MAPVPESSALPEPYGRSDLSVGTERLVLRDMVPSDLAGVHAYASDPAVARFMIWGPNTLEDSCIFLGRVMVGKQSRPREDFVFVIERRSDARVLGAVGLHLISREARRYELGYALGSYAWGEGYATEAARAMTRFGFESLDLHSLYSDCDAENLASARVLEKTGFERVGRLRDDRVIKGSLRSTLIFSLLRSEWRA